MFENRYEPKAFSELVFQNDIARKKLEKYAAGAASGNILLHGPFGSAKSTVARVVANEAREDVQFGFETEVDVLNGADFLEEQLPLTERTWNMSGQRHAYAVFDEFDLLKPPKQAKVRALMDKYTGRHGFIFTTNYLHRVDGAIQSRCDVIEMPTLEPRTLLPLCKRILVQERVTLADERILDAIEHEKGDTRRVLRQLERIVADARQRKAA